MAKGLLDLVERVSCMHQHRSIGMPEVVQPEVAQFGFLTDVIPHLVDSAKWAPLANEQSSLRVVVG